MKNATEKFLPLTHTTYYILISLLDPLHGYGIMQKVEEMSQGEVKLGPGTLYGALSKLEKQKLIAKMEDLDEERRKYYVLTALGKDVVKLEYKRLTNLIAASKNLIEGMGELK
ncbi:MULTISPECIES: PadR family transcriptional regulator [unclassified Bacillus (in: firmicutes)]|uniref:PadR family transcriptional regulator n=1 Tax=unclassified Bacillus (in: firmicutes) TaxID=185979 RepID=UPI0008F1E89E|nr:MULTISPECIES: helix-turn-helix transcriptional regulator [unclassified Bacillus (in: firmicutes)]SFB09707.1 DNA-binding transcriptional regulator, PadR family [Bacillus sp. UNCCL13]SFQ86597.1 DNA-binding transcriptional regulator, PadR family [Bacillus sp. cl95]